MSGKKQPSLQEALDLSPENSDVLIDDFSEEEDPANNLLEFSLDSFSTLGCNVLKNIQSKPHSKFTTHNSLRCRTVGRLEAGQSQMKVACWLQWAPKVMESIPNKWYCLQESRPRPPQSNDICTDNMLYKDERIKITVFCDVGMIITSVVNVATNFGYNLCHTPRYRIKEASDVSLRYSSPWGFHILPKLIWCSSRECIPGQSLCKHGPHAFDWQYIVRTSRIRKKFNLMGKEELLNIACGHPRVTAHYPVVIWLMTCADCMGEPVTLMPQRCSAGSSVHPQCVLEDVAVKPNTTANHDTGSRTSGTMHNATVQNSNPTILMLQAETGFVCKHNVVLFRCPCLPLIAPLCGCANSCDFQSRVREAMDALRTFHSAPNSVKWYERTPNEA
ncbi:hypothetical protein TNCV_4974361 [Trichonephila clavipes]|uniref:Uncharacterized protein n=1 Tax=Trichonephila clavipes TaxID=2585209 RepID=A0A8X6SEV2_TRICX|nr:hypothetical protein TNCV_4974361 [Trichonephila clavipes]